MIPFLLVISGSTATGKSHLALELARRLDTIIISADSRQVYREFDIGTAKPTRAEQNLVPHYLLDICEPTETLTLAEYQKQAQAVLASYCLHKQPLLLVGGTGLYIKSIVKGLKIPRVSPQPELRQQLQTLGQAQSYQILCQIDSIAASKIHPNDEIRTIRALEVFYVTGLPISSQQGENLPPYRVIQIGLDSSAIEERIRQRTQIMIAQGLVEEVSKLGNKYGWDLPLLDTLGYQEIKQYLQGDMTLEQAQEMTILHTRQFAKRQRTWFRAEPTIQWFESEQTDLTEQVIDYINCKIS